MKKKSLTMVLVFASTLLAAQTTGKKAEFNVAKQENVIAVSPIKMAVLYRGVANPVEIAISNVPAKYITATVDSGKIEKVDDGQFIVYINKNVKVTNINVYETYNGKSTKIGERLFRVKRIPDPTPMIGGIKGGLIDKNFLMAAASIIPYMEGFDFDLNFIITSYTFTIKVNGDLIEKNVTGNIFTPEIMQMINKAAKGTKVYFENIKAKGPDNSTRALSSIALKIV